MWHILGGEHSFKNFSSSALTVWNRQCHEDCERKDDLMNESMNYKGVCRTAMAKPGLLITYVEFKDRNFK